MFAVELEAKRELLHSHLRSAGRLLVAYSGGVDSAFLAFSARAALGQGMLAVIADSPSLARTQLEDALLFAGEQHIPCKVIQTGELDHPDYARNDHSRAVWALVIVSNVVNVFEEMMNKVSAGSRSMTASAKSVPSTLEMKRKVMSRRL